MEWVSAVPALLVAAAIATLPGLPAAWALRLRGLPLLAASISASFAIIAAASLVSPVIGLSWGLLPLGVVAGAVGLLALGLRPLLARAPHRAPDRQSSATTLGALLIAGLLIAFMIVRSIGSPENISQTYDAVFHLNAVAYVLDTGDASPLHMNLVSPDQSTTFYPTVWHATVALISSLAQSSVPLATNALSVVGAAWVWPVAILFFSSPFVRGTRSNLLITAVFAGSFSAFPYLLLTWGVLYPNFLATALLPFALGFLHLALRPHVVPDTAPRASLWIAFAGSLGATALAHPNSLFGFFVLALPLLLASANDARRSTSRTSARLLRWGAMAAAIALAVLLWSRVTLSDNDKQYDSGFVGALIEGATNAPLVDTRSLFITVFVLAGAALLLVRRRHRWLVASYGAAVLFFAVAYGLGGPLRTVLTGPWYNDAARLAALLPIVAVPLASVAAALLLDAVTKGAAQILRPAPSAPTASRAVPHADRVARAIALLAVLAIVFTGARGAHLGAQAGWMGGLFDPAPANDEGPDLLSPDEHALLERIDDEVPEDALIVGDPWNGSALVYSIGDRRTLFPHMTPPRSEDSAVIAGELRSMGAEACTYLDRLGVDYVLDFGDPYFATYSGPAVERFAGLRNVDRNPILREVDREGEAALYRVECG